MPDFNSAYWEPVIGIEVHVQLNTQSKIFSDSSTLFGQLPNSQANMIDLGMPGTLPCLNQEVVKKAVLFGLAIQAELNSPSFFERKNYFYPDLPKGYQISQLQTPIVGKGELEIRLPKGIKKMIGITRAHLEEDAGKSIHDFIPGQTGIDLNRAGMPLLEIVSEPELRSAEEAVAYLKALHELVTSINISDGNMQEGSFRADLNISVRPKSEKKFGTRTEIKNVNSFKFAEQAINYEIERQIDLLESGQKIIQETRLFNSDTGKTQSMRSKEDAQDYRYFPDPDLPPLFLEEELIQNIRNTLPELPSQKRLRYETAYQFSQEDIDLILSSKTLSNFLEKLILNNHSPKLVLNWVKNLDLESYPNLSFDLISRLLSCIESSRISNTAGKQVLAEILKGEMDIDAIIQRLGLEQISNTAELEAWIQVVIQNNPSQVAELKTGKEKLLGYLVGQVLKLSGGKANPGQVKDLLLQKIHM